MAAGITIKLKRKAGAFASGELTVGELGVDTSTPSVTFSPDGTTNYILGTAANLANKTLNNLSAVAINTDLLLGTSDGGALGSATKMWSDLFLASGAVVNFNNGDVTLTHSADTLTVGGGDLALGANNLTMTGSLGATGARLTKGWFTDLQVTNAISGSITGNAATVTTNANLTGDVTSVGNATTVGKINGTSLAGLATGILKNTTTTGVPSIAVAGDFPTLNQNTTGSAATLTTARTIGGVSFDGSANITVASATGGFTVSGGNLAVGANDLTMTGSLGATGSRLTKGWFTDLQVTNAIAGSITGNAATVTTNANLTGHITSTGNATVLGSFTMAQLNTAISDDDAVSLGSNQTITGIKTFSPTARTTGAASYLTLNIPADTGITTATESIGLNVATATRTWVDGTVALQREVFFAGPTYNKTTTSATFTDAFTLYATPPVAGTGVTFTRGHTLGIVDSTSAASSITGGLVISTTIGTTATSVGIGGGNINAGGTITGGSTINAVTGYKINGAASSGKVLVGDGTNFVASTPTFPNASATALKLIRSDGTNWIASTATFSDSPSTAGKILVSDGTNWITSTPTFPNASATTRKMIVSDGTNWVASTETWPTPSTNLNIMRSDGTNWTSVATPTWNQNTTGSAASLTTARNIGGVAFDGTAAINPGVPLTSKSAAYTFVLGDANQAFLHPAADTTARTFTIDSNANVAYPVGTFLTIVNEHSAGTITIAITTDTLRLVGTGLTGNRTLIADSVCTAYKITNTSWIISGSSGLS